MISPDRIRCRHTVSPTPTINTPCLSSSRRHKNRKAHLYIFTTGSQLKIDEWTKAASSKCHLSSTHSCNLNFSSSRKVESGFKRKDQVHIFKGSFLELKAAYFSNDQKQVDFLSERTFPISPLVVRSRSSLAQSHILSRAGKTEKERELEKQEG